jgi:hypothetical protein
LFGSFFFFWFFFFLDLAVGALPPPPPVEYWRQKQPEEYWRQKQPVEYWTQKQRDRKYWRQKQPEEYWRQKQPEEYWRQKQRDKKKEKVGQLDSIPCVGQLVDSIPCEVGQLVRNFFSIREIRMHVYDRSRKKRELSAERKEQEERVFCIY